MKEVKCKHCKGTGEEPHSHTKDYNGLSCIECNGRGTLVVERMKFSPKKAIEEQFKEFPQNELQKKIYDFWSARGFPKVTAVLGNLNVSLHREEPRYEELGILYIYLEQFYLQAKKEVIEELEKRKHEEETPDGFFEVVFMDDVREVLGE